MTINNLRQAESALKPYVPLVAQLTGKDMTLQRIRPLVDLLGNPEKQLRVIHIAGTSGKTSTAYYMAALLKAAGQKTGLTVSPHIDKITERVQFDGQVMGEAEFCSELAVFLQIVKTAPSPPSYFELMYAFALWEFVRNGVDYAVVETGMGGLHDATNVVARPDKLCILTDIGLDHQRVLGHKVTEIAAQKAGIVHPGNHLLMYDQDPAIMAVVRDCVARQQGTMETTTEIEQRDSHHDVLTAMPEFQRRNWLLAKYAYDYLRGRDGLPALPAGRLQATQAVRIPARMETITIGDKTIVMDGAHNRQKMETFVHSFEQQYAGRPAAALLAVKSGKEYRQLIPVIKSVADKVITTTFDTTQDLPVKAMDPDLLAAEFSRAGVDAVSIADQGEAVQALLDLPHTIAIITGSFYLLGQIRNNGYLG